MCEHWYIPKFQIYFDWIANIISAILLFCTSLLLKRFHIFLLEFLIFLNFSLCTTYCLLSKYAVRKKDTFSVERKRYMTACVSLKLHNLVKSCIGATNQTVYPLFSHISPFVIKWLRLNNSFVSYHKFSSFDSFWHTECRLLLFKCLNAHLKTIFQTDNLFRNVHNNVQKIRFWPINHNLAILNILNIGRWQTCLK